MSSFFKYRSFLFYSIRFFLLASLLLCHFCHKAQSSVFSSGKDIENQNGSLSFTIGATFFVSRNQGLLTTEGIQQSYTINEIASKLILRVALFPNPTSNLVYFKVENLNYKNLSYRLYDINGRLITSGKILNDQTVLSLQNFPSNIFIVKVFRGELEEQSFKIFKAN
ncbi:MAG: hypothetical protein RIR47_1250 [Bacteroidota bacterium]|jgi:hypothetical protein